MLSCTPLPARTDPGPGLRVAAALAVVLLVPALAAACSGEGGRPPPAVAPPSPAAAGPATPVIPGQRPFTTPPAFTLPRVGGGSVSLADYAGKRSVVVVFYRGHS